MRRVSCGPAPFGRRTVWCCCWDGFWNFPTLALPGWGTRMAAAGGIRGPNNERRRARKVMMRARQEWRDATTLFWQRPWLWVPTLSADFSAFFIQLLQQRFSHWLVLHLWARSVLTGEAERSTAFKAAMADAPFLWGSYFLHIAFYATALFWTASAVRSIRSGGSEGLLTGLHFARARWRSILRAVWVVKLPRPCRGLGQGVAVCDCRCFAALRMTFLCR